MANNGLVVRFFADTRSAVADIGKLERALGRSATAGEKWQKGGKALAGAIGVAAAAAGALAVKVGVDAVQAAMEEEKSIARLSKTLTNLGLASEQAGVEKFIDDLQFASMAADDELRPAFDRLVRSTGDVSTAQAALRIALDTSAGSGKSLETVAQAIGKAFDGNTGGLSRLGAGLDKATLKTGDMNVIMGELARTFGGQAQAATETLAGKMALLSRAGDELQESLGQGIIEGFMAALSDGSGNIDNATDKLREMQATAATWGKVVGDAAASALGALFNFGLGSMKVADVYADALALIERGTTNLRDLTGYYTDEQSEAIRRSLDAADAAREQAMRNYALSLSTSDVANATTDAAGATVDYNRGLSGVSAQAGKAKTAIQRLQAEMDKFAKNRSIAGQKLTLSQMRMDGPGKKATAADLREFGLGYADQASRLASDLAEQGNFSAAAKKRARQVLANARQYLGSLGLGSNFTDAGGAFLGTPDELRSGTGQQRLIAGMTGQAATTINYNFAGDIVVQRAEQAVQEAKRLARLQALTGGRNAGARRALDAA